MPQEPMTAVLGRTAAVGPFFSVRTNAGAPGDQGFLPLAELYGEGVSPALRNRLETVATRLGTAEARVAASLVHQGLAGRLWSIALGPAVLAGRVPDLAGDALWWHPDRSAPDDLWLPFPSPSPSPSSSPLPSPPEEDLTSQLRAAVLRDHLVPLHHAISAATTISPKVLWGNAASALAGTLRVLHDWCRSTGHREAAERAVALTASLLETTPLRDCGTLDPTVPAYSRRSCCLYYRVPGGGLCGDCVLRGT
ncbi:(2Fe-2S)-binding protein [Streptomyces sp. NRRL S-337]|uniref:(2Fe-2S)-binding protein n=1 Tax=Streptomyces sp. NRRL S-337 TaxID=1463900 RepID=UPI000AA9EBF2|nr:(2Fe-2S)-binding protein [Streptomyces sp. NRRL S-337]